MQQPIFLQLNDGMVGMELPSPEEEVLPGVPWGSCGHIFSPAFWAVRAAYARADGAYQHHRIGRSLVEEVAACLLGGFGMPAELGLLAFDRLAQRHLLSGEADEVKIREALLEPLNWNGRKVRYRYPVQKAKYLSKSLASLNEKLPPKDCHVGFRNALVDLPGIGFKTASWITRNHLDSDEVAILDIHIFRAGLLAGVFHSCHTVERNYIEMEARLVAFAKALGVRLSILDAIIWAEMRKFGALAATTLGYRAALGFFHKSFIDA